MIEYPYQAVFWISSVGNHNRQYQIKIGRVVSLYAVFCDIHWINNHPGLVRYKGAGDIALFRWMLSIMILMMHVEKVHKVDQMDAEIRETK